MLFQRSFTLYSWQMEKSFMMKIEIILRGNDIVRKELFFPKNWNKSMAFMSYTVLYGYIRRWTDTQIQIQIILTYVPGTRRIILRSWHSLNLVFFCRLQVRMCTGWRQQISHLPHIHKQAFESPNEVLGARSVVGSVLEIRGWTEEQMSEARSWNVLEEG